MSPVGRVERALVGRHRELAGLREALPAAGSSGRIVLITGEAGIGKTHLAKALLEDAAAAEIRVGVGRACESEGAPAFFVWSSAFDAIGRPLELKPALAGEASIFATAELVAEHARGLCVNRPVVLLLEDLQWADAPALLALRLLALRMPEQLLVLGTVRTPELVQPSVADLLREVLREDPVITLGGLPPEDLGSFPESKGLSNHVVKAVHRATNGNPFFAREVLRDSVARHAIAENRHLFLPDGVRDVLARRVASVGDNAEILACAALGPQPRLDSTLVARVLACSQETVVVAFETALQMGVLARNEEGLAFSHDLMRVAAIEHLPADRRTRLHEGWARALAGSVDPHLIINGAIHAVAADPISLDESLRERAFHAGTIAMGQMSFRDASELFEFAASADERAGRLSGAARALSALAEAVTSGGNPERGAQVAARALELGRIARDPHAFALAAIASSQRRRLGVTDASLIQILDEALRGLEGMPEEERDIALVCGVEARLAAALQPFVDPPRALSLGRSAIARARIAMDERLLARTLHAARPAFRILDSLEERLEMDSELLFLATKHGDRVLAAQARERLCILAMERGDAAALDANLEAFVELANDTRFAQHELSVRTLRTAQFAMRGEIAAARAQIAAIEEARPRWSRACAVVPNIDPGILARLSLGIVVGDDDSYRALAEAPHPPLVRQVLTLFCDVRCGRRRQAAMLYEQVVERVMSPQAENFVFRMVLGNAMIALGDRTRAAELYAWMDPFQGRHVVWTPFHVYDGSVDRIRAGLAVLLGEHDAAARHYADAIAAEQALGAVPFARRTRAERDAVIGS